MAVHGSVPASSNVHPGMWPSVGGTGGHRRRTSGQRAAPPAHPEVRSDEATSPPRRHPSVPCPARCRRRASPARLDAAPRLRRLCSLDRDAADQATLGSTDRSLRVERELARRQRSGSDGPGRYSSRLRVPHKGQTTRSRHARPALPKRVRQKPQVSSQRTNPKADSGRGHASSSSGLMASTVRRPTAVQALARVSILAGWAASQAEMSPSFESR